MAFSEKHPLIFIDDDVDDCDLMKDILGELGHKENIFIFNNGMDMLAFLEKTDIRPFMIISDINMPVMNGLELRAKLREDCNNVKYKTVPFVFFSTTSEDTMIQKAYDLCIHGFFTKPNSVVKWTTMVAQMIDYWKNAKMPGASSLN